MCRPLSFRGVDIRPQVVAAHLPVSGLFDLPAQHRPGILVAIGYLAQVLVRGAHHIGQRLFFHPGPGA